VDVAFKSWEAKHGQEPDWKEKDFSGLSKLLRRRQGITLDEFRQRWTRYLDDSEEFVRKQGHSLAYFCSKFDAYIGTGSGRPPLTGSTPRPRITQ
jgi:hypothetical protein